ncbi:MAG TPA: two-component regulator propeller domain-containing protein [Puia sp.]|nr:two-component regulator propeller domain-containing protein [Puia sp.]
MKSKFHSFIFILMLIVYRPAMAQHETILFSNLDSLTGTSLGKINAITQDPNGIMWFAGNGADCLYRYDGNTLTSFKQDNNNPNSLGFKLIETVYADKQGMIWIGGKSLDKFDPRTGVFTHYKNVGAGITGFQGVLSIFEDHRGNVWIGTFQGLEMLDEKTGKFIRYVNDPSNPKSLSDDIVEVIYEDKKNQLWIGTGFPWADMNKGGLNRMNADGSFTRFMYDSADNNSLLNNKIRAIYEDGQGNFWVGTNEEALHKMNREKGSFERFLFAPKHPDKPGDPALKSGNKTNGITFLNKDKSGALWMGTDLEGLIRYDPRTNKITRYNNGNGFPDSTSFKGFISRDGTLWVASELSNLLYKADPVTKAFNTIYTGFPVFAIMQDKTEIWVSTFDGGLLQYDQNLLLKRRFKHDPGDPFSIQTDSVGALFKEEGRDTIWVGTFHGVQILNTITQKFSRLIFTKNPAITDFIVACILKDSNQNLWLGTLGAGLIRYNLVDGTVKQWLPEQVDSSGIGSNNVPAVFEDHEQNIWLGTFQGSEGTWKYETGTGKFHNYLPGKTARKFYVDHEGVFWVCTNDGLFRYNKKEDKFTAFFDSQTDINNEMATAISEDREGNLWLTTRSAIVKVNSERNGLFVMGKKYGIRPEELYIGAFCRMADNRILAGKSDGFYYFNPDELFLNMDPMKLVVTDFFLSNKSGSMGKDSSLISQAENTSTVALSYDQNNFGIVFSANDYRSTGTVRYYTMLENYDPVWRQSGVDRIVHYFNLAPGDYIFRLKAYSPDGPTGERQILIHISPPWWKTIWAYLVFGILVSGSVLLLYRNRINSLKKRQVEQIRAAIHAQEEERKRISRDLHDDIGTKLSALKLFISSLELKASASRQEEIVSLAQSSEQFIQEVVKDLRNLLINLSPTVLEDFGYTNAVEGLVNKINETKLIHFDLNVFGFKKRLQKDYELALYRITQELINNILKHADAKNISLQTGLRDDKIVLIIEDDGKGFDVNQQREGYGLKNLETRTKLLNGKIIIESIPGKGTTTLIEIPYNFI